MNMKLLHSQPLSVVYCRGSSPATGGYEGQAPYYLACLGEIYGALDPPGAASDCLAKFASMSMHLIGYGNM